VSICELLKRRSFSFFAEVFGRSDSGRRAMRASLGFRIFALPLVVFVPHVDVTGAGRARVMFLARNSASCETGKESGAVGGAP